MNDELKILKQMIENDIGAFEISLKKNPQDEYFKGALREAKDTLYEINKMLEED